MSNLDILVSVLREEFNPISIYLFGSIAGGNVGVGSDIDIAVIQDRTPVLGQKADLYLKLLKSGYDWNTEPDVHFFSKDDFEEKLKAGDLFVKEIASGRVIYG